MSFQSLRRWLCLAVLSATLFGCDSTSSSTVDDTTTTTAAQAVMFVASNNAGANTILSYSRNDSGTLTFLAETATGGSGSGVDAPSGGNSIVYDPSTDLLYAVNSGSNSISLFLVETDGSLVLLDVVNSGGANPVSLAVNYNVVYVLNAGTATTPANIQGFLVSSGQLTEMSNSVANLSVAEPEVSQIQFAPAGTVLTVTEASTGLISNFTLDSTLANPVLVTNTSAGTTPSAFDYTPGGILLVAERFAQAASAGAVSSYNVGGSGLATALTSSLATGQTGSNSVKILSGGTFAAVTNSGTDNVSVSSIASAGTLTLTSEVETTGDSPTEMAVSADEQFLYVLNSGDDSISIYSYSAGILTPITTLTGLPLAARGITGR